MVIRLRSRRQRAGAALTTELVVALGVLVGVLLPLSYGYLHEIKLARIYYQDAVAMEILDGETEILAAGEWRSLSEGEHELKVHAGAASNLPPGRFTVARTNKQVVVRWLPAKHGRPMTRTLDL